MRLIELFEKQTETKGQLPPPRNPVAKNAQRTGAGAHSSSKYNRKIKHKNKDSDK